ncbi:MAG: GerMN domain-containing protein [Candidatus Polarisedimenticolia bacterium]
MSIRIPPAPAGAVARAHVACLAVVLAAVPAPGCGRSSGGPDEGARTASVAGEEPGQPAAPGAEAEDRLDAILYFADEEGRLTAEAREMHREPTPALQARALIEALASGPRTELTPVLPSDTAVRALHITADGTAYVDLNGAFVAGLQGGSEDTLLALRSLVETLAGNVDEIRRVKVLVEGEEARELGGHLDLSRPLAPRGSVE